LAELEGQKKLNRQFLDQLNAMMTNQADIASFITTETYLNGEPFSFDGHEYQIKLLDIIRQNYGKPHLKNSLEIVVSKISQLGISEICYRFFLANMEMRAGTSVLLSFPTSKQSSEVFQTRWANIIKESPRLKKAMDPDMNNASVKQMVNNSIAYALAGNKGTKSALISRPISHIMIDECDRQDPEIINSYGSRTTHTAAERRLTIKVSTPTAQGVGIDAEISEAETKHIPYVRCEHCGRLFFPDYFEHVRVPGYEGGLEHMTLADAAGLDLYDSYLECPECYEAIAEQSYEWVEERNPLGIRNKHALILTPFICKAFVKMGDLVSSMLTFTSRTEWRNQKLGLPAELKDSSIQVENIKFVHQDKVPGMYLLGMDMGKVCHIMIGRMRGDLSIHVEECHVVMLHELDEWLEALHKRLVFGAEVMDANPYNDKVYQYVRKYPRMFSANYEVPDDPNSMPEMFKLRMTDKHDQIVRQISINKNPFMDLLAQDLGHYITFEPSGMNATVSKHIMDMRRVRDERFTEDMRFKWVKSQGSSSQDHFFHSLVYLYLAGKMAAAGVSSVAQVPVAMKKINPDMRRAKLRR